MKLLKHSILWGALAALMLALVGCPQPTQTPPKPKPSPSMEDEASPDAPADEVEVTQDDFADTADESIAPSDDDLADDEPADDDLADDEPGADDLADDEPGADE